VGRASRRGSGKRKSADVEWKTVTLIYPDPNSKSVSKKFSVFCLFFNLDIPRKRQVQHFLNLKVPRDEAEARTESKQNKKFFFCFAQLKKKN
jgi:hypothetical protein